MRKPRDIDAELKALTERTRELKARRVVQLGELVVTTGADALDVATLAGALLHSVAAVRSEPTRATWSREGAAFFRSRGRKGGRTASEPGSEPQGAEGSAGGAAKG